MSHTHEWKSRRDEVIQARKDRASKILRSKGIEILSETKYSLILKIDCVMVEYFPFTGGFTGRGVTNGRGLKNLLALKKRGHYVII